jgi:transmembrane 9 superfamily protein 2/4
MRSLIIIISIFCAYGFNLPGNAPREYQQGENVQLRVSKLSSEVFQVPYEYYYLNFCPPENGITTSIDENLGQILIGEALSNTAYRVCLTICSYYMET